MKRTLIAASLALAAGAAFAGPAADEARVHFQAIGTGDTSLLARGQRYEKAS